MSCLYVSVVLLLGCSYVAAVHPPVIGTIFREKQLQTMAHIACSRIPSKQVSDACKGCIWRLSNDAKKPEVEGPVDDCSTYFKSTMFQNCSDALADKISSRNDGVETPFCEFDECIRRADNKHMLNVCAEKAAKETEDQVEIVTKTITCLFCRAHCLDENFVRKTGYMKIAQVPRENHYEDFFIEMDCGVTTLNSELYHTSLT